MSELLLPGSDRYENILHLTETMTDGTSLSDDALYTIASFWQALCLLRAANAVGPCLLCPTAEAWASEALAEIREAIEEKTCAH